MSFNYKEAFNDISQIYFKNATLKKYKRPHFQKLLENRREMLAEAEFV